MACIIFLNPVLSVGILGILFSPSFSSLFFSMLFLLLIFFFCSGDILVPKSHHWLWLAIERCFNRGAAETTQLPTNPHCELIISIKCESHVKRMFLILFQIYNIGVWRNLLTIRMVCGTTWNQFAEYYGNDYFQPNAQLDYFKLFYFCDFLFFLS